MTPITPIPNNKDLDKTAIKPHTSEINNRKLGSNGVNKITALFMFVFLLFSAIPAFASQFQPIKEISEFEKEVISNAAKKPADEILKEAVEFRVSRNLVILKFQNGDEGVYAYGTKTDLQRWIEMTERDDGSLDDHSLLNTSSKTTENNDSLEELANEFQNIWSGRIGDELSTEELQKADIIMQEYRSVLLTKEEISFFNIDYAARRGNRYLMLFEPVIAKLSSKDLQAFWYEYIFNSDYIPPTYNRPSPQDKYWALQNLRELSIKNNFPLFLWPEQQNVLKELDPYTYDLLNSLELIEDPYLGP